MQFTFEKLEIQDVIIIEAKTFPDDRGFFMETYKESIFRENGIDTKFVQDNFSHSSKDALRGLHYQKNPMAQAKLVNVICGEIFDVAVDIRKQSPTYGKWVGEILSNKNHKMLYIPEGFAHGFLTLSDEVDVLYKVNNEYSPENDRGIMWNDPDIGINWPTKSPLLSEKDTKQPLLKDADDDFVYS